MNKKKYFLFLLILVPFFIWYLLFKQSDYTINFKVKTATGVVFQGVKDWAKEMKKVEQQNYTITQKKHFDFITVRTTKNNQHTHYYWNIKSINDSLTAVSVGIKEDENSIYNRLTAPLFPTHFKETQISKITEFKNNLKDHLSALKVKIEGEGTSDATFVAYLTLKTVLQEKAQNMIRYNSDLMVYFAKNKIEITGKPFCDVLNWDIEKEEITFDYCFPIDEKTPYIPDSNVKFKLIPAKKGLKATYYGNMRTSDRAWFALMDYAKARNIKLSNKPLEHFFANPFNGGDELSWETKIIIPFEK